MQIPKVILLQPPSISELRCILKAKFGSANKRLIQSEIVASLTYLIKTDRIKEEKNVWKLSAKATFNKNQNNSEVFIQYLYKIVPKNPENNLSWPTYTNLENLINLHIKTYVYKETNIRKHLSICSKYIEFLIFSGEYPKCLSTIKKVGIIIPDIQESLSFKAIMAGYKAEVFRMKGKNRAAKKLLQPLIKRLEKKAAQYQIELAQLYTVYGLILLYDDFQQFSKSKNYLQRALLIRQINLGEKNVLTVTSHINMALYYIQMHNGKQAIECINTISNYLHSNTNKYLDAWMNDILGLASYYERNILDAIRYCEKGFILRRQFLKKGHSLLIESMHNVGYLLFLSNKPYEALEYLTQTFSRFKKTYTPEHQNYLITVGINAICNLSINRIEKAEEIVSKEASKIMA